MAETETMPGQPQSPWVARPAGARRQRSAAWQVIAAPGAPPPSAPVEPVPEPEAEAPTVLVFDEGDLARACAGIAAAVQAAEAEAAAARDERRIAEALEAIADRLASADAVLAAQRRQFREAAAVLAAAATEALALGPGVKLAARLADALAADCLGRFAPELALTVEVAPDIADALAARLAAAPVVKARPGRVAVEPVPGIGPGEARLVWADGVADWSAQRLHADAAALIRRLVEPAEPSSNKDREEA